MTLPEILQQVHDLTLTPAQAEPLIRQACADRNAFAASALQGRMAAGVRPPNMETLAADCFACADAMVAQAGRQG